MTRRGPPSLRARAGLLRVVEREPHHVRGDPLLLTVELADLELGARAPVLHRDAGEGDVLLEYRRPGAAGDDAHLLATVVHAVAVAGRLVALEFQTDQRSLGMRS